MEFYERIKHLRKNILNLSQDEFGKKLGVNRDVINNIERNRLKKPEQKEPLYMLICSVFNVSENWLRTGEGEIFKKQLPHDEVAEYVEELLEYDGEGNPFYDTIIDMMKAYSEMDDLSQKAIKEWFGKIYRSKEINTTTLEEEITPNIPISPSSQAKIEERVNAYRAYLETKEKVTGKLLS